MGFLLWDFGLWDFGLWDSVPDSSMPCHALTEQVSRSYFTGRSLIHLLSRSRMDSVVGETCDDGP